MTTMMNDGEDDDDILFGHLVWNYLSSLNPFNGEGGAAAIVGKGMDAKIDLPCQVTEFLYTRQYTYTYVALPQIKMQSNPIATQRNESINPENGKMGKWENGKKKENGNGNGNGKREG